MRRRRMKARVGGSDGGGSSRSAYYHCVSRVVNRDLVFGPVEKEKFLNLMRLYERFCGLRVVAYCLMGNHFHILVEVPERPVCGALPDDVGLVEHVRGTLGSEQASGLEWTLRHYRGIGADAAAETLRLKWFARMWDVSAYMKVLKQSFSQWYNGRKGRKGTLWEERFRSVLVEGQGHVLRTMAAYIDLNPVRAGICEDPAEYRWSGYGEAVAGGELARAAVRWLAELDTQGGQQARMGDKGEGEEWQSGARDPAEGDTRRTEAELEALRVWRCDLFGVPVAEASQAEEMAKGDAAQIWRRRISRGKALEVLGKGGRLSRADYLRLRVRYFTDGVAIGTKGFVEEVFAGCRGWFSENRKTGARSVRGLESESKAARLHAMRALQRGVFG